MNTVDEQPVVTDGGDRACVRLLLELRARIAELPGGTLIYLAASDPAAPIDLPAWCHLTGHTYLGPIPTTLNSAAPVYALRTAATPRTTDPVLPGAPIPDPVGGSASLLRVRH